MEEAGGPWPSRVRGRHGVGGLLPRHCPEPGEWDRQGRLGIPEPGEWDRQGWLVRGRHGVAAGGPWLSRVRGRHGVDGLLPRYCLEPGEWDRQGRLDSGQEKSQGPVEWALRE